MENHLKTAGEHLEAPNKASGTHEIAANCGTVFQELKIRRKHRFIIFRIGEVNIDVESVGARTKTVDDLISALPFTDCRYVVYDHEYKTHDGRLASKLWFISWLPLNATTYNKMAYAHAKAYLSETLTGVFDTQATTSDELLANIGLERPAAAEEDDDEDWC